MASRPRPSLLALFDPLSLTSPQTPTRGDQSPSPSPSLDSGSDKENLNTTTPRCVRSGKGSIEDVCSETVFFKRTYSRSGPAHGFGVSSKSPGKSFSLDPDTNADATNLCLVRLEDELDSASGDVSIPLEELKDRIEVSRQPLKEIDISSSNSYVPTPQRLVRDKRLVNVDSPMATPRSASKFAAGVARFDPSTPTAASSFHMRHLVRSPSSLASPPTISVSTQSSKSKLDDNTRSSSSLPSPPLVTQFPGLTSSTPSSAPVSGTSSPPFQDPPPGIRSASFEIQSSFCIKKIDLSGDLLNDEISFLTRMEDDSFLDYSRGDGLGKTDDSSPSTEGGFTSSENSTRTAPTADDLRSPGVKDGEIMSSSLESPKSVASTSSSPPSSPLEVDLNTDSGFGENDPTPDTPAELQLRTPSSSPLSMGNSVCPQVLAPKKTQALLRGNSLRVRDADLNDKAKAKFDAGAGGLHNAKRQSVLHPRASYIEVAPPPRTQYLASKNTGITPVAVSAPTMVQHPVSSQTLQRSASTITMKARSSLNRRTSIGKDLVSGMPKVSDQVSGKSQGRLSMSMSSTIVAAKGSGTTIRPGGARRVPMSGDAPLSRTKPHPPAEVPSASSKARPQRPPASVSGMGMSTSSGGVAGKPASFASGSRSLSRATSSTAVKVSAKAPAGIPRAASMSASSRLPMPQPKSTSRIPGPMTRKVF
ncbi:hypothetical protein M0805_004362 [Coniferiporia weirii]|nr:hypothetical protein M0805_004362 [Coniferiporia weirii]